MDRGAGLTAAREEHSDCAPSFDRDISVPISARLRRAPAVVAKGVELTSRDYLMGASAGC